MCGFLNGNIGVAKCVLGEISDATNKAKVFALIGTNFGIGIMIGPMLGGLLSNPSVNAPYFFADVQLFITYPYLLPCLCSASISMIGFLIGLFFLPETNVKQKLIYEEIPSDEILEIEGYEITLENNQRELIVGTAPAESIEQPKDRLNLGSAAYRTSLVYALLAFQNLFWVEIFPLWAVHSPTIGLGFSGQDIGHVLGFVGVFNLISLLIMYPLVSRFVSPLFLCRMPIVFLIFFYSSAPLISTFLASSVTLRFLVKPLLIIFFGFKALIESTSFTSMMILVNNSAKPGQLGLVNGLAQTSAATMRFIAPLVGGTLWAWSLQNGLGFPFNNYLIFFVLCVVNVSLATIAWNFLSDDMYNFSKAIEREPLLDA
jgi:hypothetical protein